MPAFIQDTFSGMMPRMGRRQLGPAQAQLAVNCRLTSGELAPLRAPLQVAPTGTLFEVQTMYRMNTSQGAAWLYWPVRVSVVRSLVGGDTTNRLYYTGDGEPRVTNETLAAQSAPYPSVSYVLGVLPPETAPTVSSTGGAGADVDRVYVYTFVAKWPDGTEEESMPSPPSVITTGKIDDTWTIEDLDGAPPNSGTVADATVSGGSVVVELNTTFGLRAGEKIEFSGVTGMTDLNGTHTITAVDRANDTVTVGLVTAQTYTSGGAWERTSLHNTATMVKRLYELVATASGGNKYYLIKVTTHGTDIPIGTSSVTKDNSYAPVEELRSLLWEMPPTDLHSLSAFPGGLLVGLSGNRVCFCDPDHPYAWPEGNQYTLTSTGVSLGIFGNNVVVATDAEPEILTGIDPSSMSQATVPHQWPCKAARGLVSLANGVMWPTVSGLAYIGAEGPALTTRGLYQIEEWDEVNPESFIGAVYDGRYVAAFSDDAGTRRLLLLDPAEPASLTYANVQPTALHTDTNTGALYFAQVNEVFQWDADIGRRMSYDWVSSEKVFAPPLNMAAAKVDADFSMTNAEIAAAQAAYDAALQRNQQKIVLLDLSGSLRSLSLGSRSLRSSTLAPLPALAFDDLLFQLICDGQVRYTRKITNNRAFKLPSGYKSDNATLRLSGNVRVLRLVLAGSMTELNTV